MQNAAAAQSARNILKSLRHTYSGKPQTRVLVQDTDFRHLDLSAYRRFRTDMEARGYRFLADYEIADAGRAPGSLFVRTFVRNMLSADGSTVCCYYQVKQRLGKRLWLLLNGLMNMRGRGAWDKFREGMTTRHCVDVGSSFTGGRSLCVSNAQEAGKITNPPVIEMVYFPYGTAVDALLKAHGERMRQLAAEIPGLQTVAIAGVEDLFRLQELEAAQKAAYRKSVNWVTHAELLSMASGNLLFADAVYEAILRQLAAEMGEAGGPAATGEAPGEK